MILRPHQQQCISAIIEAATKGDKEILVVAPCGFGKTIIFCELAKRVSEKNNSIIIVVDSINLVLQTKDKIKNFVLEDEIDICCGSLGHKKSDKKIVIGTIQTLKNIEIKKVDVVIFDEAHDGLARIEKFGSKFSEAYKIGFTATPYHANGVAIYGKEKFFKRVHYRCDVKEMVANNFLVPMIYQEQMDETKIDVSNVPLNSFGDYNENELQKTYSDNYEKVILQIKDMVEKTKHRNKIIVMCTGITHADFVYSQLPNSALFHSQLEQEQRFENLNNFKVGKTRFLVGVSAIYKGLDVPEVDALVMMRPTRSYPFYAQYVGRGARTSGDKRNCLFLDYGEVIKSLGCYDSIKEVAAKKDVKKIKKLYPKSCKKCGYANATSVSYCVHCDEKFVSDIELNKVKNTTTTANESVKRKNWYDLNFVQVRKDVVSKSGNLMDVVEFRENFWSFPIKIYLSHKFYKQDDREKITSDFNKSKKVELTENNGFFKVKSFL